MTFVSSRRGAQCSEELQTPKTWLAQEKRFHFVRTGAGEMGEPAVLLAVDNLRVEVSSGRTVACFHQRAFRPCQRR